MKDKTIEIKVMDWHEVGIDLIVTCISVGLMIFAVYINHLIDVSGYVSTHPYLKLGLSIEIFMLAFVFARYLYHSEWRKTIVVKGYVKRQKQ